MSTYRFEQITEQGIVLDCLTCSTTGASIRVAPEAGLNWTHWIVDGVDHLWKSEDFFTRNEIGRFGPGGSPLLFPMVGRTWDLTEAEPTFGQYRFEPGGKPYHMPIHGFGASAQWERLAEGEEDGRGILRYRCCITDAIRTDMYPFDIDFQVTYGLDGSDAFVRFDAMGTGENAAPFAFGIHPFLALSSRAGQVLSVPSSHDVPLAEGLSIPAQPGQTVVTDDFSEGRAIDLSTAWDRVFTKLTSGDVHLDDGSGKGYALAFDHEIFDTCIVYTDATSPCLCIEPWTGGLGGFAYAAQPEASAACGMQMARANEMLSGEVRLSITS